MPTTDSPLRYPGGKTQLAPLVIDVMRQNKLFYGEYAEPFAGGCGLAWKLLLNDYVTHVYVNDLDRAIFSFWYCVLNKTDDLCARIEAVRITLDEWQAQKLVQASARPSMLDLGFSTFFLNRTNRSGIITGGVIGGVDQSGNYKLDCRFSKDDLIRKIRRIASRKEQVSLSNLDAAEYIESVVPTMPSNTLVNLDPPYYVKGPELYKNHYTAKDHAALAKLIPRIRPYWMVTYDDTPETRTLYRRFPSFTNELNYTAQVKKIGFELVVLDPRLIVPSSLTELRNAA